MAILFVFLVIGQAFEALEATKTTFVLLHLVLGSAFVAGSAFYFLLWRKGRGQNEPDERDTALRMY